MADTARKFAWQSFRNATLRRMFSKIVDIGYAALSAQEVNEVRMRENSILTFVNWLLVDDAARLFTNNRCLLSKKRVFFYLTLNDL